MLWHFCGVILVAVLVAVGCQISCDSVQRYANDVCDVSIDYKYFILNIATWCGSMQKRKKRTRNQT